MRLVSSLNNRIPNPLSLFATIAQPRLDYDVVYNDCHKNQVYSAFRTRSPCVTVFVIHVTILPRKEHIDVKKYIDIEGGWTYEQIPKDLHVQENEIRSFNEALEEELAFYGVEVIGHVRHTCGVRFSRGLGYNVEVHHVPCLDSWRGWAYAFDFEYVDDKAGFPLVKLPTGEVFMYANYGIGKSLGGRTYTRDYTKAGQMLIAFDQDQMKLYPGYRRENSGLCFYPDRMRSQGTYIERIALAISTIRRHHNFDPTNSRNIDSLTIMEVKNEQDD